MITKPDGTTMSRSQQAAKSVAVYSPVRTLEQVGARGRVGRVGEQECAALAERQQRQSDDRGGHAGAADAPGTSGECPGHPE
jgi:hypothetical protein